MSFHLFPGHYVYYYANQSLSVPDQVLLFPSHQFLCGLSFSYFIAGALDLDIIRENMGVDTVYVSQDSANSSLGSNPWESVSYVYNASLVPLSSGRSLYFEASQYELGEAPLELPNQELFLALDNVSLTFCLPCDYDSLVEPGAIVISGPQRIDLELRRLTSYQFNASAPACPNETLVFNIESGKCNRINFHTIVVILYCKSLAHSHCEIHDISVGKLHFIC
jgi:hypothetical protein